MATNHLFVNLLQKAGSAVVQPEAEYTDEYKIPFFDNKCAFRCSEEDEYERKAVALAEKIAWALFQLIPCPLTG